MPQGSSHGRLSMTYACLIHVAAGVNAVPALQSAPRTACSPSSVQAAAGSRALCFTRRISWQTAYDVCANCTVRDLHVFNISKTINSKLRAMPF